MHEVLRRSRLLAVMACAGSLLWAGVAGAAEITGDEVVRNCDFKYPGDDQRSTLSITLKDKAGNERKTVYARYWKDMKGKDNVLDKMVLFTIFPPDAKGAAFMRWAYAADANKNAEQWIYLPVLRKIRRVSVRDLSDSFLGSDLTYGDISYRPVEADRHELIGQHTQGRRTPVQQTCFLVQAGAGLGRLREGTGGLLRYQGRLPQAANAQVAKSGAGLGMGQGFRAECADLSFLLLRSLRCGHQWWGERRLVHRTSPAPWSEIRLCLPCMPLAVLARGQNLHETAGVFSCHCDGFPLSPTGC